MESENTGINSKAFAICNNVEGDLISVRLKGLQNLVEWTKIHSNGSLLNYLMKEGTNYMSNKVFVHKDYTNALRQKAETRKYFFESTGYHVQFL